MKFLHYFVKKHFTYNKFVIIIKSVFKKQSLKEGAKKR